MIFYRIVICCYTAKRSNVMNPVLPEDQESMERWDYYNMQLQDMMEQK